VLIEISQMAAVQGEATGRGLGFPMILIIDTSKYRAGDIL